MRYESLDTKTLVLPVLPWENLGEPEANSTDGILTILGDRTTPTACQKNASAQTTVFLCLTPSGVPGGIVRFKSFRNPPYRRKYTAHHCDRRFVWGGDPNVCGRAGSGNLRVCGDHTGLHLSGKLSCKQPMPGRLDLAKLLDAECWYKFSKAPR